MPKILSIEKDTKPGIRELIAAQLDSMKPGEAIVLLDWAKELGVESKAFYRHIPEENRMVARVAGRKECVSLLIKPCPSESPSRPPRKKR